MNKTWPCTYEMLGVCAQGVIVKQGTPIIRELNQQKKITKRLQTAQKKTKQKKTGKTETLVKQKRRMRQK